MIKELLLSFLVTVVSQCPANTYNFNSQCVSCPSDSYSLAGSTSCSANSGFYNPYHTNSLYRRFTYPSYRSGVWYEVNNKSSAAVITSTITTGCASGNGATTSVCSLSGATGTTIDFGAAVPSTYTICSVTRYTGTTNRRILNGQGINWFHGHWLGATGKYYYNMWRSSDSNLVSVVTPITNWIVGCGNNGNMGVWTNNTKQVVAFGGTAPNKLLINAGSNVETSTFAIMEVATWNSLLSDNVMSKISVFLMSVLRSSNSSLDFPQLFVPCENTLTCASGQTKVCSNSGLFICCNPNTYLINGFNCTYCAPGTINNGQGCTPCGLGTYQNNYNATACTLCQTNTYQTGSGSSTCTYCSLGSLSNGQGCTLCGQGTYQNNYNTTACILCPVNTYQTSSGSSTCTTCSSGLYQTGLGGTECFCVAGLYNSANTCKMCAAGTFTNTIGATTCDSCPSGTYSPCYMNYLIAGWTYNLIYKMDLYDNSRELVLSYSSLDVYFSNLGNSMNQDGWWTGDYYADLTLVKVDGSRYVTPTEKILNMLVEMSESGRWGVIMFDTTPIVKLMDMSTKTTRNIGFFSPTHVWCSAIRWDDQEAAWVSPDGFFVHNISTNQSRQIPGVSGGCYQTGYTDGVGINAQFSCVRAMTYHPDGASVYFSANQYLTIIVRYVFNTSTYTTIAGGNPVGCLDGTGLSAVLGDIFFMKFTPNGTHLIFTDTRCPSVRQIELASLSVQTVFSTNINGEDNGAYGLTFSCVSRTTSCKNCQAPSFSLPGSSYCTVCAPGSFKDVGSVCTQCLPGYYSSGSGQNTCDSCLAGQYQSGVGLTVCLDCSQGSYQPTTAQTKCDSCLAGQYQTGVGLTVCLDCSQGSYQPIPAQTLCLTCLDSQPGEFTQLQCNSTTNVQKSLCGAGTFSTGSGLSTCVQCSTGTYQPSNGTSSCTKCSPGTAQSQTGKSTCVNCLPGDYVNVAGFNGCVFCAMGKYQSGYGASFCNWCPPGTKNADTGRSTCIDCVPGSFTTGSGWGSTCPTCNIGSYQSGSAYTSCNSCSSGTYITGTGFSACSACSQGSYQSAPAQTLCLSCSNSQPGGFTQATCNSTTNNQNPPCAAGTFSTGSGLSTCTQCGAGTYQTGISTTVCQGCTACSAGNYVQSQCTITTNAQCSQCNPGYFSNTADSTACSQCGTGLYQSNLSSTTCQICGIGSYTNISGLSACISCSPGSSQALTGASYCDLCPPGTFQYRTGKLGCYACQPGTYETGYGGSNTSCPLCNPGTYQLEYIATSCLNCIVGSYQMISGASWCDQCVIGTYQSGVGFSICSSCTAGLYQSGLGISLCSMCQPGSYSTKLATTTCNLCSIGTYQSNYSSTACSGCTICGSGLYIVRTCNISINAQCSYCPIGYYQPSISSLSCLSCSICQPGNYTSIPCNSTNNAQCSNCPVNTYTPTVNMSSCLVCSNCPAGKYISTLCTSTSDAQCQSCQAGTIQTQPNMQFCDTCNAGFYNPTNTSTCSSCQPGSVGVCTIYISGNRYIYAMDAASGEYYTLTGSANYDDKDGVNTSVRLKMITSLSVLESNGSFIIANHYYGGIKRIWVSDGRVETITSLKNGWNGSSEIALSAGDLSPDGGLYVWGTMNAWYMVTNTTTGATIVLYPPVPGAYVACIDFAPSGNVFLMNVLSRLIIVDAKNFSVLNVYVLTAASYPGTTSFQSRGVAITSDEKGVLLSINSLIYYDVKTWTPVRLTNNTLSCVDGFGMSAHTGLTQRFGSSTLIPDTFFFLDEGCWQMRKYNLKSTQVTTIFSRRGGVFTAFPLNPTFSNSILSCSSRTTQCKLCEAGTYKSSQSNVYQCDQCSIGSYQSNSNSSSCVLCAPGKYNNTMGLSSTCTPCSPGTYQNVSGGSLCYTCLSGQFQNLSGSSYCFLCPSGTYNSIISQSTCVNCRAGSYGTGLGLYSGTQCLECPVGAYSTSLGLTANSCNVCAPGTYGLVTGAFDSSYCLSCPLNNFCSGGSAYSCPKNTTSLLGSSRLDQCLCVSGFACNLRKVITIKVWTSYGPTQEQADAASAQLKKALNGTQVVWELIQ